MTMLCAHRLLRLLDGQPADHLYGRLHRAPDGVEAVQGAQVLMHGAMVRAQVGHHEVHAQTLQPAGVLHRVGGHHQVAQDTEAPLAPDFDRTGQHGVRRGRHDVDGVPAVVRHHVGEVGSAVDHLHISDEERLRELAAEGAQTGHPVDGKDRRAGLDPIHAGFQGDLGDAEDVVQVLQIEGDLNGGELVSRPGEHSVDQAQVRASGVRLPIRV